MKLTLPFPPSTNTYWRHNPNTGRVLLSKKARQYKKDVYACVLEQLGIFKPLHGELAITVELFPPDKRKRDLDNFSGKALWDALVYASVLLDDSQIKESHNYMRGIVKPGRCEVELLAL